MDTLLQDLRFTLRTLARQPAFTLVAVLTLMLGIGANTAIFTIVNAVLLSPLPYPDADRLVLLWGAQGGNQQTLMSVPDVVDLRDRSRTLESVGIIRVQSVNLTGTGEPDRLVGNFVSAATLEILGARVAMGRTFTRAETEIGTGQQVAVVSSASWKTRFGGDSAMLGRTLLLNGRPHTVIGVTSAEYQDPYPGVDVYLPITSAPNAAWFSRGNTTVWAVGRLKPGVTLEAAQRDLTSITTQLTAEYPTTNAGIGVAVSALQANLTGNVKAPLLIVLASVAVVLLIACANVANLLLARAAARRREMALRSALGAGRSRLVRQLLTESLVLFAAGGITGVLVAQWATRVLVAAAPGGLPVYREVGMDLRVLAFTVAVTVVAGLLFGAAPAVHAARLDLNEALKLRPADGAIGRRVDARSVFVALQLALCIVLLVGAGLLTRSLITLQQVNPGFEPKGLLTAEFRLPQAKYKDSVVVRAFMERAIAEIRAVPGVRSAALVGAIPMSGNWGSISYVAAGQAEPAPGQAPSTQQNSITSGFFATMRIPMVRGRDFDSRDAVNSAPVAIINEELARRSWPGQDPIGKQIRLVGPPDVSVTVVGVVGNIRHRTLSEPPTPQMYNPIAQAGGIFSSIVVRTDGDPMALARTVRGAIWAVDPDQPVWKIRSQQSLVERDTAGSQFTMRLISGFALIALLLAVVGVYGVMSYAVEQRTREVGIRMALGAHHQAVVRMVLGRGLRVVAVATVVGVVAAYGAAKLLRNQLFGVGAADPLTFVAVPLVLASVAALACYLPARRAARVDPVIALRSE